MFQTLSPAAASIGRAAIQAAPVVRGALTTVVSSCALAWSTYCLGKIIDDAARGQSLKFATWFEKSASWRHTATKARFAARIDREIDERVRTGELHRAASFSRKDASADQHVEDVFQPA